MPTFGTLKTRISNAIKLTDTASLSRIGDAINRSIDFFENEHFGFNEATSAITLTADNEVVPNIPTDFEYEWQNGGLVLVDNQIHYPLQKITHEERASINSEVSARPTTYTVRNNQILLYPIPDQAYTVNLFYIKTYADLTLDTESNDWTNNAASLLQAKSLGYLYLDERHGQPMADRYEQQALQEKAILKTKSQKQLATGRLRVRSLNFDNGRLGRSNYRYWGF